MAQIFLWLNQNAAAVQAIAGLLSTVLAVVLILVTMRYVRLTDMLVMTGQNQLRAVLQPTLELSIIVDNPKSGNGDWTVKNVGVCPVQLSSVVIGCFIFDLDGNSKYLLQPESRLNGKVLLPQSRLEQRFRFRLEQGNDTKIPPDDYSFDLRILCTDITGSGRHTFIFHAAQGLTEYYPNFPVNPTAFKWFENGA